MKGLSKHRESISASVKLKVDNELLIIMMCQCRFILRKKKYIYIYTHIILLSIDNKVIMHRVRETSLLLFQLVCQSKIAFINYTSIK